jgi:hypothetical protein
VKAVSSLRAVPFESDLWCWETEPAPTEYRGRPCIRFQSSTATLAEVELVDGAIELDLAVTPERGFHGVVWRLRDDENFESFFVRPHQTGNDDAIQYTPVFNGISSWQLYHGAGFWSPVAFPLDDWFTVRVTYAGERAEIFVGDLDEPALAVRLRGPVTSGRIGVFVGGPAVHLGRFAYDAGEVAFRAAPPAPVAPADGVVPVWWVSDAFPEAAVDGSAPDLAARRWTQLPSEPSGLADLARVNGIREGRNTVFARATIHSGQRQTRRLDFGFSDRATVYLNGRARYRGDDTYRSRDYRFLGSIGYWDSVYLPLDAGDNELVVAVSEDFGGWGVQARFDDASGLTFATP